MKFNWVKFTAGFIEILSQY